MNKKFVLLSVLGLFVLGLFGVSGVLANTQEVITTVDGRVDFTLNILDFGLISPGSFMSADSTITLNQPNNVDFIFEIYLATGSDPLFDRIRMDLNQVDGIPTDFDGAENSDLNIGVDNALEASVDDTDPATDIDGSVQVKTIPATLTVPIGAAAGERTATIMYVVTSPSPI